MKGLLHIVHRSLHLQPPTKFNLASLPFSLVPGSALGSQAEPTHSASPGPSGLIVWPSFFITSRAPSPLEGSLAPSLPPAPQASAQSEILAEQPPPAWFQPHVFVLFLLFVPRTQYASGLVFCSVSFTDLCCQLGPFLRTHPDLWKSCRGGHIPQGDLYTALDGMSLSSSSHLKRTCSQNNQI